VTNRLILDTDGGIDDAQALLLLIANGRPPDAITTVFGNVDLQTATYNILSVLAVAGSNAYAPAGGEAAISAALADVGAGADPGDLTGRRRDRHHPAAGDRRTADTRRGRHVGAVPRSGPAGVGR